MRDYSAWRCIPGRGREMGRDVYPLPDGGSRVEPYYETEGCGGDL